MKMQNNQIDSGDNWNTTFVVSVLVVALAIVIGWDAFPDKYKPTGCLFEDGSVGKCYYQWQPDQNGDMVWARSKPDYKWCSDPEFKEYLVCRLNTK